MCVVVIAAVVTRFSWVQRCLSLAAFISSSASSMDARLRRDDQNNSQSDQVFQFSDLTEVLCLFVDC